MGLPLRLVALASAATGKPIPASFARVILKGTKARKQKGKIPSCLRAFVFKSSRSALSGRQSMTSTPIDRAEPERILIAAFTS